MLLILLCDCLSAFLQCIRSAQATLFGFVRGSKMLKELIMAGLLDSDGNKHYKGGMLANNLTLI